MARLTVVTSLLVVLDIKMLSLAATPPNLVKLMVVCFMFSAFVGLEVEHHIGRAYVMVQHYIDVNDPCLKVGVELVYTNEESSRAVDMTSCLVVGIEMVDMVVPKEALHHSVASVVVSIQSEVPLMT